MNNNSEHISTELIAAYLSGDISRDDALVVEAWIDLSKENRLIFDSYRKIWDATSGVKPYSDNFDADMAWNKLSSRIEETEKKANSIKEEDINNNDNKSKLNYFSIMLRIAAVLLPAIFIVYILIDKNRSIEIADNNLNKADTTINMLTSKQLLASTDNILKDKLPDGTQITLNRNSKLTFTNEFNEEIREVLLDGEAFFEVKKDADKPFIVYADAVKVRVLGTSFSVSSYNYDNEVEVYVKSGEVAVYYIDSLTNDTSLVLLSAGNKGIFNKKIRKLEKHYSSEDASIMWFSKQLVFSKTELSTVFEVLEKYYRVKIKTTNKDIKRCRLSAVFKEQSVDTVLDVIAKSFDLTFSKDSITYTFEGKGCE